MPQSSSAAPAPYFAAPPSGEARPRVLLVSYNFPPTASVGALRWEKLSGLLYERGWAVDAITVSPETSVRLSENVDPGRLRGLPPDTRVWTVAHDRPASWDQHTRVFYAVRDVARRARRLGRAPAPAAAPAEGGDAQSAAAVAPPGQHADRRSAARRAYLAYTAARWYQQWRDDAAALARQIVTPAHTVVATSGPPHVAHEAGRIIAARTGLPLVLDLRDPWSRNAVYHTSIGNKESPVAAWFARRAEQAAVPAAALVVCNTDALRAEMVELYPEVADRAVTVMNGVDDDPLPPPAYEDRFLIAFAGSIYIDRDPTVLFRGLRLTVDQLGLTPADIGIALVGRVEEYSGGSVRALAEREGVSPFVTLGPPRTRDAALAFQARAQMLASLPQDSMTQIPAKTFEYVAFPAWLLIHTPPGSATARLLAGTGADLVDLGDAEGTAEAIARRYRQWRAGERPAAVNADGRFGRRAQAAPLLDAMERLAGAKAPKR